MRLLFAALAYLASLAVVVAVSFFAVLVLAGPHAGLLPGWLEVLVFGLGWAAVLIVPALIARKVWRRHGSKDPASAEGP